MTNDQYFPMEANMMSDERLAAVTEKYGAKGIGIYFVLLLELRKHENYRCGLNTIRVLTRTYCLEMDVMESVVHDFGLFELTGDDNRVMISSPYLDRVMKNLEQKRTQRSKAGKKGAASAGRAASGRFTVGDGAVKNNIVEVEEIKPDDTRKIKSWDIFLIEALNDQAWLECQGMHSGLGERFYKYETEIVGMFMRHVKTHGTDGGILSVKDVKYYFANFVRTGTVTNKRIVEELARLERDAQKDDAYRFETIDPQTGQRSFYGKLIPDYAPPRPDDRSVWNDEDRVWE